MIVIAYAIAILLPLLFLYLVYAQDLYGQGKFRYVLLAFGWGLAAFGLAYAANGQAAALLERSMGRDAYTRLPVLVAPFSEELLKALILIVLARRMTYFVDGAIYGFAAGIAFSVLENVLYLSRGPVAGAGLLALVRALSTCLMHGAASALVGTAVGRFRYGHGGYRLGSVLAGWALAIGLHMAFNRLLFGGPRFANLLGGLFVSIGGAALIVIFIRWGLAQEKRWLAETLGLGVGVTRGEVAVVQQYDRIDEMLEPIAAQFGEEKGDQVEEFLLKQAQLGIKRKARSMTQNPAEQQRLDAEAGQLRQEMEALRKKVGVYCMSYVRMIFPEDVPALWAKVEDMVARRAAAGPGSLDAGLAARLAQEPRPAAEGGLWSRLDRQEPKV